MDPAVQQAVDLVVSAPSSAFAVGPGEAEHAAVLAQALLERACALRAEAVALVDVQGSGVRVGRPRRRPGLGTGWA